MKIKEVKVKVKIPPSKFVLELTAEEFQDLAGICELVWWDTVKIAKDIAYAFDTFELVRSPMKYNPVEGMVDRYINKFVGAES